MGNLPKISEAEWEVMKIIWSEKSVTATFIIDNLSEKKNWKASTIKTLINRLLNKGVLNFDKKGKEYLYYALFEEDKYIQEESKSFLSRFFGGSINSMLLNFVKDDNLTEDDINELKAMLDNKDSKE